MTGICRIDLGQLPIGAPVVITTESRSVYTIVRVAGSQRYDHYVDRVLITSGRSNDVTAFGARFSTNRMQRYIEVGKIINVFDDDDEDIYARTSPVRRIVADPKYVARQDTGEL